MTCHSIEESFSGYFDTHHGACLGVLEPIWMDYASRVAPAPFARFARNVMGVSSADDAEAAAEGIVKYNKWLDRVQAPARFADFGPAELFTDEGFETVASNCLRIYGGSIGRIAPITKAEDVVSLLERGRSGR